MLTDAAIKNFRRQAATHDLTVEHVLEFAAIGDPKAIPLLQELKHKHNWSESGVNEHDNRITPFARWSDVVCTYLDGGYDRIASLAIDGLPDTSNITFCSAVLETLETSESVTALLRIAQSLAPLVASNVDAAITLAGSFNLILSFKDPPSIAQVIVDDVCSFLHDCLANELTEPQRCNVACALRGVGNLDSIKKIRELPRFKYPYEGLEVEVIRKIRKRLKSP